MKNTGGFTSTFRRVGWISNSPDMGLETLGMCIDHIRLFEITIKVPSRTGLGYLFIYKMVVCEVCASGNAFCYHVVLFCVSLQPLKLTHSRSMVWIFSLFILRPMKSHLT